MSEYAVFCLLVCASGIVTLVFAQIGLHSDQWVGWHLALCGNLLVIAATTIWGLSHHSLYWPCGCATLALMVVGSILDFGGPRRESAL